MVLSLGSYQWPSRFSVPPETALEYVVATIDAKEQKIKFFLDKKQVEEFDYKLRYEVECPRCLGTQHLSYRGGINAISAHW